MLNIGNRQVTKMKIYDLLTESNGHPVIVVDVQPEYANYGNNSKICNKIINFVANQTGPVLMFVNAENTGVSSDSILDIKYYWEETIGGASYDDSTDSYDNPINWDRFTIVDKGFGHFRGWMDNGISDRTIIRVIRHLYQYKLNDARDLPEETLQELTGVEYQDWLIDQPLVIDWTSVAQLKRFNGSYIVGGGRNTCLREVELLMNAFNIKYKRIDSLVY